MSSSILLLFVCRCVVFHIDIKSVNPRQSYSAEIPDVHYIFTQFTYALVITYYDIVFMYVLYLLQHLLCFM